MENEIKLIPSYSTQLKLKASMIGRGVDGTAAAIKSILGLAGCEVLASGVENITDEYWDTPDLLLYQKESCFRIRTSRSGVNVYVKHKGIRSRGQFERPEFSLAIDAASALQGTYNGYQSERAKLLPEMCDKPFVSTLRVMNQRREFLLRRRDEEYELCLDIFSYSCLKYARVSTSQMEIEIEALNVPANANIGDLATLLTKHLRGVKPSKCSKYERGVQKLRLTYPGFVLRLFESVDTISIKWLLAVATVLGAVLAAWQMFK